MKKQKAQADNSQPVLTVKGVPFFNTGDKNGFTYPCPTKQWIEDNFDTFISYFSKERAASILAGRMKFLTQRWTEKCLDAEGIAYKDWQKQFIKYAEQIDARGPKLKDLQNELLACLDRFTHLDAAYASQQLERDAIECRMKELQVSINQKKRKTS